MHHLPFQLPASPLAGFSLEKIKVLINPERENGEKTGYFNLRLLLYTRDSEGKRHKFALTEIWRRKPEFQEIPEAHSIPVLFKARAELFDQRLLTSLGKLVEIVVSKDIKCTTFPNMSIQKEDINEPTESCESD